MQINCRGMVKKICIMVIFTTLLFLMCLESLSDNVYVQFLLKHIDELMTLIILAYCFCNYRIVIREKSYLIVLVGAFMLMGGLSSILYHYQGIVPTVLDAFLLVDRFILGYLGIIVYSYSRNETITDSLLWISKIITVILFLLDMHDIIFSPFFEKADFRYFMYGLQLMFPHATYLAAASVTLLIFLGYKNRNKENLKYMIMISIVGMSTLRGKALGFFAIYWIIYVIVKYIKFKNNTVIYIIATAMLLFVSKDQLSTNFGQNVGYSPRLILFKDGIKLMMEHLPFGTGFGSFGSSIAANYYSPIYERLGYQNNYGMSSEYSGFLTDCFWPTVFAQSGFIGLVFFFLIICYFLLISIRKLKINRDAGFAMLMTIVYLLITSVAESSFFNPTAFLFFILFAVYEKEL
jgi:hypothetical protein